MRAHPKAQISNERPAPTGAAGTPEPRWDDAQPEVSPARQLQTFIEIEFAEPVVAKWPPIYSLGFIIVTCGGFWTGLGWALLHARH